MSILIIHKKTILVTFLIIEFLLYFLMSESFLPRSFLKKDYLCYNYVKKLCQYVLDMSTSKATLWNCGLNLKKLNIN